MPSHRSIPPLTADFHLLRPSTSLHSIDPVPSQAVNHQSRPRRRSLASYSFPHQGPANADYFRLPSSTRGKSSPQPLSRPRLPITELEHHAFVLFPNIYGISYRTGTSLRTNVTSYVRTLACPLLVLAKNFL